MKLKNKDFALFKKECEKWIDKLGLYDWNIKFEMLDMKNKAGRCTANYVSGNVVLKLGSDFIDGNLVGKNDYIKETALHEILELLLMPMSILAGDRTYDEGEFDHQTHRVINSLMRIL